jgi:methylase of polypeptide subunit release factors
MTYLNWRKSTYSLSNGNCVEVGTGQGAVAVRDSRDPDGPAIDVSPRAWIAFTAYLKRA